VFNLNLVYKPVLFPSFALPSSFNFSDIYRAGATERSRHTLNAINVCSLVPCGCKYRAVVVLGTAMVLVQSRQSILSEQQLLDTLGYKYE